MVRPAIYRNPQLETAVSPETRVNLSSRILKRSLDAAIGSPGHKDVCVVNHVSRVCVSFLFLPTSKNKQRIRVAIYARSRVSFPQRYFFLVLFFASTSFSFSWKHCARSQRKQPTKATGSREAREHSTAVRQRRGNKKRKKETEVGTCVDCQDLLLEIQAGFPVSKPQEEGRGSRWRRKKSNNKAIE